MKKENFERVQSVIRIIKLRSLYVEWLESKEPELSISLTKKGGARVYIPATAISPAATAAIRAILCAEAKRDIEELKLELEGL